MHLPVGATARLVLTDGYTLQGKVARSGQWGVHRLDKVTVFDRETSPRLEGHLLIGKSRVLFAQIEPAETET